MASGFCQGSSVIGWAATDLQWMVIEVCVAFSCCFLNFFFMLKLTMQENSDTAGPNS